MAAQAGGAEGEQAEAGRGGGGLGDRTHLDRSSAVLIGPLDHIEARVAGILHPSPASPAANRGWAEAVCFGVSDEKYGEAVQAAVVLSENASQDAIQDFCRNHLADFKIPDRIYVVEEMPRTATGKIQRRHIAAMFADKS